MLVDFYTKLVVNRLKIVSYTYHIQLFSPYGHATASCE